MKEIRDDFIILKQLYDDVFVKIIKDYTELPQEYMSINYVLTDIINIIIHITRFVLCNSMYIAVIKTVIKYIKTVNPKESFKTEKEYDDFVVDTVNKIVDFNYTAGPHVTDMKLEKYMIDIMPVKLVKHILKIYTDENDEDRTITSIDDLFNPIIVILKRNTAFPLNDDASLFNGLNTYIFPFYILNFLLFFSK